MKTRCLLLSLLLLGGYEIAFAHHGKGGAIIYEYLGAGSAANTSKYRITVQHYINCERTGDEPSQVYVGIFDGSSNSLVTTVGIPRTSSTAIQKQSFNPCINPAPTVCFYLDTYVTTVELADNSGGYTLAEQECCRADEIINVSNPSSVGFTNLNTIPGIINGVVYRNNSSPVLVLRDTAVICHSSSFYIDFGATDPDGDVLSYTFCTAKATSSSSRQPNPPSSPPYADVPYASGYSGAAPMGSGVSIDASTGLISGIAPATTGEYIISVCITETRNGVPISVTKKEVLVTVADCSLTAASLETAYTNCDNFTCTFQNTTTSSDIISWAWDFGVANSTTDVSSLSNPSYTYPDTGTYSLKLKVSNSSGCVDSTTSSVKVYPGFTPGFTVSGSCYQSPFQFTDATYVKYGAISSWSWDFGESTTTADVSSLPNPSYQYSAPGTFTARLNVTSSKGCSGTVTHMVTANDKPSIVLPFTDTLICSIDSLPLRVITDGATYRWTPLYNIIDPNSTNPVVYPKDTTVYTVTVKDKGCVDSASVTVNVLDFITVTLPTDTTICAGDSVQLQPVSYALQYAWSPATALSNPYIKSPTAAPGGDITYEVTANLGKCQDKASILVKTAPYPQASAGLDATICYGTNTQLQASMTASDFTWSPATTLTGASTLQPVAAPMETAAYVLTVTDTLGCPKPVSDTVVVNVIPRVIVFAGNDTSIVLNQPLQLQASSDNSTAVYVWSPSTGMSDAFVADPVVLFGNTSLNSVTYTVTATTAEGCQGADDITVQLFKTFPDLFMPNAFTPNQDGLNDVFRPVMAGIAKLDFFRVFNRWGELIFTTSEPGKGWDGTFRGGKQDTGTFVYVIEGVDYTGKVILRKGTVTLLR